MRYMKARNLTPVDPRFYTHYQWILMDRNRGLHFLVYGYDVSYFNLTENFSIFTRIDIQKLTLFLAKGCDRF